MKKLFKNKSILVFFVPFFMSVTSYAQNWINGGSFNFGSFMGGSDFNSLVGVATSGMQVYNSASQGNWTGAVGSGLNGLGTVNNNSQNFGGFGGGTNGWLAQSTSLFNSGNQAFGSYQNGNWGGVAQGVGGAGSSVFGNGGLATGINGGTFGSTNGSGNGSGGGSIFNQQNMNNVNQLVNVAGQINGMAQASQNGAPINLNQAGNVLQQLNQIANNTSLPQNIRNQASQMAQNPGSVTPQQANTFVQSVGNSGGPGGMNMNTFNQLMGAAGNLMNIAGTAQNGGTINLNQVGGTLQQLYQIFYDPNTPPEVRNQVGAILANPNNVTPAQVNGVVNAVAGVTNVSTPNVAVVSTPGVITAPVGAIAGGTGGGSGGGAEQQQNRSMGSLTAPNVTAAAAEMNKGNPVVNDYDGIPSEYNAYKGSPIMFDQKTTQNNQTKIVRNYPSLSLLPGGLGEMITRNDISVDDEISKSSKATFISKGEIQKSFLEDQVSRNNSLDLFKTERGIAMLTLAFLDKTVSASRGTVQAEADADYNSQLLKQISMGIDKMANPHSRRMYDDADEKFQACIDVMKASATGANLTNKQTMVMADINSCMQEVNTGPKLNPGVSSPAKISDYHLCVCAASKSTTIQPSISGAESIPGLNPFYYYSAVDMVFLGKALDNNIGIGSATKIDQSMAASDKLREYAGQFRALYGDVIFFKPDPNGDKVSTKYIPPFLSMKDWIRLLRDKKVYDNSATDSQQNAYQRFLTAANRAPEGENDALGGCQINRNPLGTMSGKTVEIPLSFCPITGRVLEVGICPAMRSLVYLSDKNLLNNWYIDPAKNGDLSRLFIEASLGGETITAGDLRNLSSKDKTATTPNFSDADVSSGLSENQMQLGTEKYRWMENFCDASAVSAFRRIHLRMISIAKEHLTLNRAIRDADRDEIVALMQRVTDQLNLGEADAESGKGENLIEAMRVESSRRKMADSVATTSALGAANSNNGTLSSFSTQFGGSVGANLGNSPATRPTN